VIGQEITQNNFKFSWSLNKHVLAAGYGTAENKQKNLKCDMNLYLQLLSYINIGIKIDGALVAYSWVLIFYPTF